MGVSLVQGQEWGSVLAAGAQSLSLRSKGLEAM